MGASEHRPPIGVPAQRRALNDGERELNDVPPSAPPTRPGEPDGPGGPGGSKQTRRPRRRPRAGRNGPAASSSGSAGSDAATSLDAAAQAFELLVAGPAPLVVDGCVVGCGLPRRWIRLDELRAVLLHPATGRATRDAAWRYLLDQARGGSAAWVIGAVGVALPALRAIVADLADPADGRGADVADVHAAVLAGFVAGLYRIEPDRPGVITRLRWQAYRAGLLARYTRDGVVSMPLPVSESAPPPAPWGHPDLILADAVAAGVLSPLAAELIGRSRLEDLSLKQAAAELGVGYEAARKARQRGERRLVAAITAGDVQTRLSPRARKTGLIPTRRSNPTPASPSGKPTPPESAGVRGASTRSGGTPEIPGSPQEGGVFRGPARQPQPPTRPTASAQPAPTPTPQSSRSSRPPAASEAASAPRARPGEASGEPQRGRGGSQQHHGRRRDLGRGHPRRPQRAPSRRGRGRPGEARGGERS